MGPLKKVAASNLVRKITGNLISIFVYGFLFSLLLVFNAVRNYIGTEQQKQGCPTGDDASSATGNCLTLYYTSAFGISIVRALLIVLLSEMWRTYAPKLTNDENPRTEEE